MFVEGPAVGEALQVAEGDVGLGVVGEPLEVVGDAGGGGVAGGDGPADADAGLLGVVEEGRDEVAGLRGHGDASPRWIGGNDLRAEADRR